MTLFPLLEAAIRTLAVAALSGCGLAIFRVRSAAVRLAVWRLVLTAGLLMPVAGLMKPAFVATVVPEPSPLRRAWPSLSAVPSPTPRAAPETIDWQTACTRAYLLIAGLLLLRQLSGLLRLHQLDGSAKPVAELGSDVYEVARINIPVTFGIWKQRILLPDNWRQWPQETLIAVLAHERTHTGERDFLTQSLSKLHRALYWANPLAWWLDRHLASLAEQASDDAALRHVAEPADYASILLGFAGHAPATGVAMARPSNVASRIERILHQVPAPDHRLSGLSKWMLTCSFAVAVFLIGSCKVTRVAAQSRPLPSSPGADTQPQGVEGSGTQTHSKLERTVVIGKRAPTTITRWRVGDRVAGSSYEISENDIRFNRDGKEYLIVDPKTLQEVREWFRPMEQLGREQSELGEQQGALGERMGKLGEEMGSLGEQMGSVRIQMPGLEKMIAQLKTRSVLPEGSWQLGSNAQTRAELRQRLADDVKLKVELSQEDLSKFQSQLADLQSKLGQAQALAGEKQAHLSEQQAAIGQKQAALGELQAKLGERQAQLGEQQARIAEEAEKKLERLFEEALKDGRAKAVR